METLETNSSQLPPSPSSSSSSSSSKHPNLENPRFPISSSSPTPPTPSSSSSVTRLWRPAAQRNLRNQWSKLASYRQQWVSTSSTGRSHATSLVNAYLSQRYMRGMDLGVLDDMPDIRERASWKLFKQQELHRSKLLSSYKNLVSIVSHMVDTSRSMRCYVKGPSSSSLVHFSSSSEDMNDFGDGGGIPVFVFWTISYVETLAQELVQIFALELSVKRLLVVELLSISCEEVSPIEKLGWSTELYPGEFDDLRICSLYCIGTSEPLLPRIKGRKGDSVAVRSNNQPDQEVLQIYLTTWLAEVNMDTYRVEEIFSVIGEEMHINLS